MSFGMRRTSQSPSCSDCFWALVFAASQATTILLARTLEGRLSESISKWDLSNVSKSPWSFAKTANSSTVVIPMLYNETANSTSTPLRSNKKRRSETALESNMSLSSGATTIASWRRPWAGRGPCPCTSTLCAEARKHCYGCAPVGPCRRPSDGQRWLHAPVHPASLPLGTT